MLSKDNLTSSEILKELNIDTLYKLRKYILAPAISSKYIYMSIPDKPTSSKQKYGLTQSGIKLLK